MREIVKVRAASNGEIVIAIPKDIRAVVRVKAGDKILMTARGGQIILEPEIPQREKRNKKNGR